MNKILLISLNNDPTKEFGTEHIGGQAKYVMEISKQLLYFGWMVDIYTIGSKSDVCHVELFKYLNLYRFFRKDYSEYDYNISINEIKDITLNIIKFMHKKNFNYNMVLACYWISGVCAIDIKDEFNIPFLISFSSLGAYKKIVENNKFINDRIKYEREIVKISDKIIASSKIEKQDIVKFYGALESKIYVIPRGIDPKIFYP